MTIITIYFINKKNTGLNTGYRVNIQPDSRYPVHPYHLTFVCILFLSINWPVWCWRAIKHQSINQSINSLICYIVLEKRLIRNTKLIFVSRRLHWRYYINCVIIRALKSVVKHSEVHRDDIVSSLSQHLNKSQERLGRFSQAVEDSNRDMKVFSNEVSDFCTTTQNVSISRQVTSLLTQSV